MPTRRNIGFTLIELSIVLVIIGLIVGGVLVGQDLIHAATLRAEVSIVTKVQTAYNTFITKYNCIPGDCNTASQIGLGPDGNNDGEIDYVWALPPQIAEAPTAWMHLANANLIEGKYTGGIMDGTYYNGYLCTASNCPKSKISPTDFLMLSSIGQFVDDRYGWKIYSTEYWRSTRSAIIWYNYPTETPSVTVADSYALDTKLDDGVAYSGRFITVNQWFSGPPSKNCITGPAYSTDGSANYNLQDKVNDCLSFFVF